ncbi:MAG: LysR family transcriptional regulator [Pseudomonadota bacterium]
MRSFAAIAATGHLSRATERLHRSQPALSVASVQSYVTRVTSKLSKRW